MSENNTHSTVRRSLAVAEVKKDGSGEWSDWTRENKNSDTKDEGEPKTETTRGATSVTQRGAARTNTTGAGHNDDKTCCDGDRDDGRTSERDCKGDRVRNESGDKRNDDDHDSDNKVDRDLERDKSGDKRNDDDHDCDNNIDGDRERDETDDGDKRNDDDHDGHKIDGDRERDERNDDNKPDGKREVGNGNRERHRFARLVFTQPCAINPINLVRSSHICPGESCFCKTITLTGLYPDDIQDVPPTIQPYKEFQTIPDMKDFCEIESKSICEDMRRYVSSFFNCFYE